MKEFVGQPKIHLLILLIVTDGVLDVYFFVVTI